MLCVADYLDALNWVESIGGHTALVKKSTSNLAVIAKFVDENKWIEFLAKDPATVSNTSVCLTLKATPGQTQTMVKLLADEAVAFDIGSYRDAPSGLRIWCGATVEATDLEALMPWLAWAYDKVINH